MNHPNNSVTPAGWELSQVNGNSPESSEAHWTGVDHLSGPLNPLCITDASHEILRPKPRRLSSNSRSDHSYQSGDSPPDNRDRDNKPSSSPRVNTPANLIQSKPVLYSPTVQELSQSSNINDRMVSPKRKNEYFPHLYNVANNVKTSSFSDHVDRNNQNIKNVNQTNSNDYSGRFSGGSQNQNMVPERDTGPNTLINGSINAVGSLRLPVCQGPGQLKVNGDERNGASVNEEPKISTSRPHHHVSVHELRMQRGQQCNSSSDDNRSSGHASMSDTGNSSPRDITDVGADRLTSEVQKSIRNRVSSQHAKFRHRATPAKLQVPWTGGGGLEDIKMAIQQLTMRSHTSTSTYSSVSAGSESSEPTVRRLMRHSSLETINTNVTSADEFVWVDSHNRLVELQHLPWTHHCILRVLQTGRCRDHMSRVSVETIPRLSYLLQRALVRLGRETQRLSSTLGLCSKHEVTVSFRIVLCPPLADSCIKACLRAAAMFAVSGDCALRQSKSSRAGLQLHVGRFHRWMTDVKLGKFIHEYAAVYLCAGLENLLEEILLQCLPSDSDVTLTATLLEHAIANNGDLWGLLQPFAHLNAGRIASGALALPRWASVSSLASRDSGRGSGPPEPSLLTTCVGSLSELQDLVTRMQSRIPLCARATRTLFYFMRCSQLEHGDQAGGAVQELCYERAYVVLPPLVEWLRVAVAHGEHRHAAVLDRDDIMQAARLLLPGVDCPVRNLGEEAMRVRKATGSDEDALEATRQIQMELAFRLLGSGRAELIQQAIPLLPPSTRLDTFNHQGHTALMLASIQNDELTVMALLDAGASVDIETPSSSSPSQPAVNVECQHWTALTYAASLGHTVCARLLLERGANVEGGAALSEDKCTLTPLQVASGSGNLDMVALLLAHGAHPFISTQLKDTLCYSGSAQRGCYSPISVAAAHGQRSVLQKLLAQPMTPVNKEVLSLEEMLAEGAGTTVSHKNDQPNTAANSAPQFSKAQIKALQEAMYHSAENNHLEITVEIRSMGVPWTLHCWMHTLSAAHEARLDCVIDQLLQDFLQVCPDDYSSQFVQECLPLLFNIFRYSKKEGTSLLLADIFSTCFGWEAIKPIRDCVLTGMTGSRIDPKYVNNPELSDVTFKVEGRLFYGHKIVLVTASPRLRAMLSSKLCEGGLPTVQINDIRYHIFQIVMQFLYQGGCQTLESANEDILELMAAANFFQLDGLLRYCEGRCAAMLTLDNVVSMYIHAKVYNAQQLLEYCQGFLLQNMVALLTYDDSVKRLLFAKKLPNHDVLAGLLLTLQNRIKARRNQSAIKAKLMELGCYVDDELPDYIMVMVANKRSRSQMEDDLQLFLRSDTEIFVEWLQQVLKKLKEVTITNPDVCGSFRELKRKAALEIAECVIKKEKKDKKIKTEKKTRNVELVPQIKSISDEIPVQATKLVEKRNQAIRSKEKAESKGETSKDNAAKSTKPIQIVNEDNFDIPSLAEVNELEDSQLDIVENKIKEARNRLVLMKSDSEDDDFINLRADAEELMGNELDGTNVSIAEPVPINDQRIVTITKEDDEKPSSPKRLGMKPSLAERLGARPDNSSASNQPSKMEEKRTRFSLTKAIREEQQLSSRIRSSIQSIVKKPVENKIRKKESVHKRLGLPSSVVSLPKKNDDDEQPKSMMSVVQVKPRRNVSGICQANKNLLLKAVAEAQKSVTQTPLVGKEVKNKKALYILKRREQQKIDNNNKIIKNTLKSNKDKEDSKVQNIIIEVKSKKSQTDTDDSESDEINDSYVPTSVAKDTDSSAEENDYVPSALDLTYEEDLDKFMEDFDGNEPRNMEEESEKEEIKTNHQFIVTLDGLKDKKILSEIEESAKPNAKPVKRPPSPIIFDKKIVPKSEKNVPQIPERLPKVHLPVKTKERCKYWPNCRLKEACEYVHPNTPCNVFPLCKFGDKCLYIHPKCKFDASCTRKDCLYSHGIIKVPVKAVIRPVATYGASQEVCKYHPNCSNPHCHFYHPKPCRFGKYCMNKSECNFSHEKIPNKDKLTWHSNAR